MDVAGCASPWTAVEGVVETGRSSSVSRNEHRNQTRIWDVQLGSAGPRF